MFFLLEVHVVTLKAFSCKETQIKVYCTSLKVHQGHFMGIFVIFNAFLFKLLSVNVN